MKRTMNGLNHSFIHTATKKLYSLGCELSSPAAKPTHYYVTTESITPFLASLPLEYSARPKHKCLLTVNSCSMEHTQMAE